MGLQEFRESAFAQQANPLGSRRWIIGTVLVRLELRPHGQKLTVIGVPEGTVADLWCTGHAAAVPGGRGTA